MDINFAESGSERYQAFLHALKIAGKLSDIDLTKTRRMQKSAQDDSLPELLIKLGLCSDSDIANTFVELTGLQRAVAAQYPSESPLGDDIPLRFLKNYHLVALDSDERLVKLAVMDPADTYPIQALQLATGKSLEIFIGQLSEIEAALEIQYGEGKSQMDKLVDNLTVEEAGNEDLEHLKDLASEAPIIKMVNFILQKAVENRASDVHIEPFEQSLKVRLRIDGVLQDIDSPPVASTAAVLSRIKIMAKLNIAERRLPQDGRIKLQMIGKELDLRVSTIPTLYGESVVIRLLDKENAVLDFAALGFVGKQAEQFKEVLAQPHGIILITGPTGSGKSTSLYAALKQLNTSERKIITVEDPVEYQMEGINQIQAKPQIGLTFAMALRSIVRQDPDVIMIGEMRDLETARIAVQSALTGHLVLSTLHTNDAASGITRLQDMGLEEYLLSSTINGILAQRLVRKLCPVCKQAYPAADAVIEEMHLRRWQPSDVIMLSKPVGCSACNGIGYKGRIAIIEFLHMSDAIRKQIMKHEEAFVIQQQAVQEGMHTMYDDGIVKALQGVTTLEEVLRVTTDV
ncbi:type II secretion system ATPase GspE [Methylomonas paludis]|uniref:Type II secretion system protein E n=1 Tax=Methylomonas paludis TaxID=1173101 RepID=A0A975MLB4_9GAMM|nr:type II secretion system ATPase GspE [Methylomonas paludis]QWF69922.1 type II secretion system ATPase GspE [Methylomonas paludis]